MPRNIKESVNSELFRAVVIETTEYANGGPSTVRTECFGPYSTAAAAKAAITKEERSARRYNNYYSRDTRLVVEGHIERTDIAWERMSV